jgi:hypothetical protein
MHIPHFLVNLAETMDDWDQEKLEKVVESKGMEYSNNKPTEIVRLFFQFCFLLCVSCFFYTEMHCLPQQTVVSGYYEHCHVGACFSWKFRNDKKFTQGN